MLVETTLVKTMLLETMLVKTTLVKRKMIFHVLSFDFVLKKLARKLLCTDIAVSRGSPYYADFGKTAYCRNCVYLVLRLRAEDDVLCFEF